MEDFLTGKLTGIKERIDRKIEELETMRKLDQIKTKTRNEIERKMVELRYSRKQIEDLIYRLELLAKYK